MLIHVDLKLSLFVLHHFRNVEHDFVLIGIDFSHDECLDTGLIHVAKDEILSFMKFSQQVSVLVKFLKLLFEGYLKTLLLVDGQVF